VSQVGGLDAFQTVKFFHDYIILNCSYDDSLNNYSNAYGALVEGKAVCEGYARAFKYLCDRVGIPCELVIGSTDVDHMWNVVEIEGKWYHIDLTWDDPRNKDGDYIGYTYFNLSQEEILKDHTIDDTYTVPLAYSMDMNYYNYYGLTVSSIDELENVLSEQIYDSVLNGRKYVYFRADSQAVYDEIIYSLGNDYELYKSMKSASSSAGVELDTSSVVYSFDDVMFTFTIMLG
jgi:transglutaminase/protease-like cytokinesis protein 3